MSMSPFIVFYNTHFYSKTNKNGWKGLQLISTQAYHIIGWYLNKNLSTFNFEFSTVLLNVGRPKWQAVTPNDWKTAGSEDFLKCNNYFYWREQSMSQTAEHDI